MAKQQPSLYTTAEEIDNLKRTNLSSTVKVFVEGPDDVLIFNTIAKHKGLSGRVNFIGRGGRGPLLELYDHYILQRPRITHTILFFADQDTWVFTGIPSEYAGVYFTKGYSIENDLFEDGESNIISLLYEQEKDRFAQLIESVVEWFAQEMRLILDGHSDNSRISISLLNPNFISPGSTMMNANYQIDEAFRTNENELIAQIQIGYRELLRGKFFFDLIELLRQDRQKDKENLPIPPKDSLFSTCIAEGLRNTTSNSTRIAQILQNTLNSTPPII